MPLRAGFMPLATRFLSRVFCSATGITYKIIFLPFRILFKATAFKGRKKHTKNVWQSTGFTQLCHTLYFDYTRFSHLVQR